MLILKQLSNVKNSKTHNAELVIATTVAGDFKITGKAAEKIGLFSGAMGQIVGDPSTGQLYIAKGLGEALRNEDGTFKLDDRKRKVFEGNTIGSVVSSISGGALLKMSNTAAWNMAQELGEKDAEGTREFTLGEPQEAAVLIDEAGNAEDPNNQFVTNFYPLVFSTFKAKTAEDKEESTDEDETQSENETVSEPTDNTVEEI